MQVTQTLSWDTVPLIMGGVNTFVSHSLEINTGSTTKLFSKFRFCLIFIVPWNPALVSLKTFRNDLKIETCAFKSYKNKSQIAMSVIED